MSFDVEFLSASQTERPQLSQEIRAFLSQRPNYQDNGPGLMYVREATGTYGSWSFLPIEDQESDEAAPVACLAVNFFRPSFFMSELFRQIDAVQRHFRLTVHDPQSGVDHHPEGGAAQVLGSYANHARSAARAHAASPDAELPLTLPRDKLAKIWEWNDAKDSLQNRLGDNVYVPTIMLARVDSALSSVVVWTDGIPVLMPKVDVVLIHRHQTAPRQGLLRRRIPVIEAIRHTTAATRFREFGTAFAGWPDAQLFGHPDPSALQALLSSQPLGQSFRFGHPNTHNRLEMLSMDSVTDAEFLSDAQ